MVVLASGVRRLVWWRQCHGRLFIDALASLGLQLQCRTIVAWAAGNSLGFWKRVDMVDKQAADADLRSQIQRYQQIETGIGFADSRMVAKLL